MREQLTSVENRIGALELGDALHTSDATLEAAAAQTMNPTPVGPCLTSVHVCRNRLDDDASLESSGLLLQSTQQNYCRPVTMPPALCRRIDEANDTALEMLAAQPNGSTYSGIFCPTSVHVCGPRLDDDTSLEALALGTLGPTQGGLGCIPTSAVTCPRLDDDASLEAAASRMGPPTHEGLQCLPPTVICSRIETRDDAELEATAVQTMGPTQGVNCLPTTSLSCPRLGDDAALEAAAVMQMGATQAIHGPCQGNQTILACYPRLDDANLETAAGVMASPTRSGVQCLPTMLCRIDGADDAALEAAAAAMTGPTQGSLQCMPTSPITCHRIH